MSSKATIQIAPLAVAVVLDARRRVESAASPVLCTLFGNIADDGTVLVKDAFPNFVSDPSNPVPMSAHHDGVVSMMGKTRVRDFVVGFATTNMSDQQMMAVCEWSRQDSRVSKFSSQKRLPSPVLLFITPVTGMTDLACRVMVNNYGQLMDMDVSYGTLNSFAQTYKRSDMTIIFDTLIDRIDKALEAVEVARKNKDVKTVIAIQKAISMSFDRNMDAFTNAHVEEKGLYECMSDLAKLEVVLCNKLNQ